jgi:hypothetical protein
MAKLTSAAGRAFTGIDNPIAHMGAALGRRREFAPVAASTLKIGAPAPSRHI